MVYITNTNYCGRIESWRGSLIKINVDGLKVGVGVPKVGMKH